MVGVVSVLLVILAGVFLLGVFVLVCFSIALTVSAYLYASRSGEKQYYVFSPLDTLRLIYEVYSKGGD